MKSFIEGQLGFALHQSSYIFKSAMKNTFKKRGISITPDEFVILAMIGEDGPTQSDLSKRLKKEKTVTTKILIKLEEKGWITKSEGVEDRRNQIVSVTKKGQEIRSILFLSIQEMYKKAKLQISENDLNITYLTLLKIANNLSDNVKF